MADVSETGWDGFVEWAKLFRAMPDFDGEERDYKERATAPIVAAHASVIGKDPWLDDFIKGFKNPDNNIVSHWAFVPFLDWIQNNEEEAASALENLWSNSSAEARLPQAIDDFWEALPDDVVSGDGSRCNIASYLLASTNLPGLPVYRVTAFNMAFELTRTAPQDRSATVGERYASAIAFLDELIKQAAERDLVLRDRLDAQSLVWCITSWGPKRPPNFDLEQWNDLLEYRTAVSKIKKAAKAAKGKTKMALRPGRGICPQCANEDEVQLVGPIGGGRWEFICEVGPAHSEPYEFSLAGV